MAGSDLAHCPATIASAIRFRTRDGWSVAVAGPFASAWADGMEAGRRGEPAGVNPHARGSDLARCWEEGWRDGTRQRQAVVAPDWRPGCVDRGWRSREGS